MKQFFKGIRKKEQGNKFVTKYYIHVITSHNVEQEVQKLIRSDVVIPNKLGNGETCQGLRHWRLLSNLKNNLSKPVRNDMNKKILRLKPQCPSTLKPSLPNFFPYSPFSFSLKKTVLWINPKDGQFYSTSKKISVDRQH